MTSNVAPFARDVLYLSFLFFGVSLGAAFPLVFFRRQITRGGRARRRVVGAFFFTFGVISGTTAFVFSAGTIFSDAQLLTVSLPFIVLAFAGVIFPRIVGFPLCVALGSALILFSWTFLVFPEAREGVLLGRARVGSSGEARFWFESDPSPVFSVVAADRSLLRFAAVRIDFDRRIPLVGATTRVALRGIASESNFLSFRSRRSLFELLGDPDGRSFFIVPGVSIQTVTFAMSDPNEAPGARFDILWANGRPRFSR